MGNSPDDYPSSTQEFARVPWNMQSLALPATPPSVRLARDWVTRVLVEIGRDDLTDSARLAVSELVTNAILHADPPMTVYVRGTLEHPRIEVADQSLVPPRQRTDAIEFDPDDEFSWTTVGRGLDLVASYARAWGADIDARGSGKVVWFEPSPEPRETPTAGELFDLDEAIEARGYAPLDPRSMVTIELLNLPTDLFAHLRVHFNELGRELRLLSISAPGRYPIAAEFTDVYLQVELERRHVTGLDVLDAAMRDGAETVDLSYSAPPTAPASMALLSSLLDTVYDTMTDDALLVLRPPAELIDVQHWYLGEFVRQGAGG
ncbi:MAG: hypothetical protein JWP74_761, partial [Marmoricola sp.]|nr:hypothetical protein [Marmoricola sp.]